MPTLTFRGAYIRFVDLRYEPKSKAVYTKINFTATYSKPVRDELNWPELPESMPAADLDGNFTATEFTIIPNGLDTSAFNLDAKELGHFSVHRVASDNDQEKTEEELRFQIVTPDKHAASKLAKYLDVVGHGAAQLKVKYNAQSTIENEASDQQEKLISEEQAADTAEGADEPEGKRGARAKKRAAQIN
jgi:hypothetical protein